MWKDCMIWKEPPPPSHRRSQSKDWKLSTSDLQCLREWLRALIKIYSDLTLQKVLIGRTYGHCVPELFFWEEYVIYLEMREREPAGLFWKLKIKFNEKIYQLYWRKQSNCLKTCDNSVKTQTQYQKCKLKMSSELEAYLSGSLRYVSEW